MKTRLVENILLKSSAYKKVERPLMESEQNLMVEGNTYKALAVYRFEFTRPGQKNLNGRVYPYALWDRVIALSPVTLALMDHPEEGAGNPKDVWAVVRNPQYSEDKSVVYADAYIIDNENGRSALGVLEAGGDLGLSSSGFGDFLSDGITVDPDTFTLERYFDWVLQPSYEVFGHQEDKLGESAPAAQNPKQEGVTMKTLSLREKREFEISMKRIYEETSSIVNPQERLAKATEALTFYEEVDSDAHKEEFEQLVKQAEEDCTAAMAKAAETETALKKVEDAELELSTLRSENAEKDQRIAELEKELASCKEELDKEKSLVTESKTLLKSFTEDASHKIDFKDYLALREYSEKAVSLLKEKRSQIGKLQAENEMLKSELALSEKRLLTLADKAEKQESQAALYRQQIEEARKQNEKKIQEAREKELVEGANPEVVSYYEDLVARGEKVESFREEILKKKTLSEAQMLFLRKKNRPAEDARLIGNFDLSTPLSHGRGTAVNSQLKLPKGFI